jgi:hypothetical protein
VEKGLDLGADDGGFVDREAGSQLAGFFEQFIAARFVQALDTIDLRVRKEARAWPR